MNKKLWLTLVGAMLVAGWTVALWPKAHQVRAIYMPAADWLIAIGAIAVNQHDVAVAVLEIVLNVLVYVPFSCVMYLGLTKFRVAITLGFSLFLSVTGELAQLYFVPERVPTIFDVYANFAGAILGLGLALVMQRFSLFGLRRKSS